MRAIKNRTVEYLDAMDKDRRELILKKAITRKQRDRRRESQKDLRREIQKRQEAKKQARDIAQRKELEKKLKKSGVDSVVEELSVSASDKVLLEDILNGKAVGRDIVHIWSDEKLKEKTKYRVAYWGTNESYDDSEDYDIPKFEMAVDLLLGDLVMTH
jgi:hypothetical protein